MNGDALQGFKEQPMKTWTPFGRYAAGMQVEFGGAVYEAIQASAGASPTDPHGFGSWRRISIIAERYPESIGNPAVIAHTAALAQVAKE